MVGREWCPEILLFVDDQMIGASERRGILDIGVILVMLMAMGIPYKWSKFRGGFQVDSIGFRVDFESFRLGISEARAQWLVGWWTNR